MAARQTKAEKIAQIPIEKISKMSGNERKKLESYVRTMKAGYKRRVQSFARKGLDSYAQISFEASIPDRKPLQLTEMTRNQLIMEFARYAKFFNDVTSTEKGIKKVNLEQDIRIFGKNKRGRPLRTMTRAERKRYWELYGEYLNQNPTHTSKFGSETIQQQIAEAVFGPQAVNGENLVDFLDRVEKRLSENKSVENLRSVPNVYSGRGDNFTK